MKNKYTVVFFMMSAYLLYLLVNAVFPSVLWFPLFVIVIFALSSPRYVLSPKCIVFTYYFLWFGISPVFAERYSLLDVSSNDFFIAYAFLSTSYCCLMMVCVFFCNEDVVDPYYGKKVIGVRQSEILILLGLTIMFLMLYVKATGGVSHWIVNIDRVFLTRQGAGVYYLGFSLLLPLLLFLVGLQYKNISITIVVVILVLLLSPLIGSKQKIIFMFLVLFLERIYYKKVNVRNVVVLTVPVLSLFVLGNYFRNASWMQWSDVLAYSLNYFDTLDSLLIVLRDFKSFDFMSIFLPFNKFFNLAFGTDEFFDVSAYLTSIYFPHAWDIRATVQFPVEVDLYLSLGYWFGLPLLVIFCGVYCVVYMRSLTSENAILKYIWFYLFIYMLSHLRGGVILWTDFYVYPYLIALYFIYRNRFIYVQQG